MCTTVCSGGALPRPAQRGCSLVQLSSHYSLPSRKGICLQVIIHDNVFNDNKGSLQVKGKTTGLYRAPNIMNAFNYTRLKRLRAAGESTSANRASSVVRVGGVRGDIVVD